jgi:hypothetical protein
VKGLRICTLSGPVAVPNPDCPKALEHTPCPTGYVGWHEWAAEKAKTHRQRRCEGCGLYNVWEPREQATST